MKDIEQEEKEKQEKDKEEKKQENWFTKVPAIWKLGGLGVIFFKYQSLISSGGEIKELFIWIIVIVLVWYFIGSESKRRTTEILTPREAEEALDKEIQRKIKKGQINKWAKIYTGPNNGLFHHEGLPQHYQIGVEIVSEKSREYKRGVVFAEGETKGFATLQEGRGRLTGREAIPVISPIPNWLKRSKKYDLDLDKYMFGGGK